MVILTKNMYQMRYGGRGGGGNNKNKNSLVIVKNTYNNEPQVSSASASTKVRDNIIFLRVIIVGVLVYIFRIVDDKAKYGPSCEPPQGVR